MNILKAVIRKHDNELVLFYQSLSDLHLCFHKGRFREVDSKFHDETVSVDLSDEVKDFINEYEIEHEVTIKLVRGLQCLRKF